MEALIQADSLEALIPMVTAAVGTASTKHDYARELRNFFTWYGHVAGWHKEGFARGTIMAYREAMQEAGRGPVSINKALCAIRLLAREAAANGYMDGETASRIEQVPQVERRGTRLGTWLTLEELKLLLTSIPPTTPNRGTRDRAAMWLLGACGLRREEAAGLKRGQLQVRDGRAVLVDVIGKGNKTRSIPIHSLAAAAAQSWCDLAGITDPDAWLLPTMHNPDVITTRRADGARIYDACRRYAKALGQEFRPHDLRRTFALLAEEGGAPLREISDALGHASVTTTEIYLRAPRGMKNAATDKIKL